MAIISSSTPVTSDNNTTPSVTPKTEEIFVTEQANIGQVSENIQDTSWIQETNPTTPQKNDVTAEQDTPNETTAEVQIPNMYIQADNIQNQNNTNPAVPVPTETIAVQSTIATTPTPIAAEAAVDLDSLFETPKQQDPIATETPTNEIIISSKQIEKKTTNNDHKTMQKFAFAIGWWAVVIGGLYFIIQTMFPLGFGWATDTNIQDNQITFMTGTEETTQTGDNSEQHSAPVEKTEEEIYVEKLVWYENEGKKYNELGKVNKDRDLIRYGLFIQKKALDLQDEINLAITNGSSIDKVSLDAYIAQFDEYLDILETTAIATPTPESVTVQTQESEQTDTGNNTADLNNFLQQYTIPQQ